MSVIAPFSRFIAHRGASAYAPENTMAAFDKALAMGCQTVEFDVMLSADGEPFVIHDERLERTSNGRGGVGEVSAEYLRSLDAGSWFSKAFRGERIPHLRDVLSWLNFTNMQANIEIKPYKNLSEQTTVAVLSHLHRYWSVSQPLPLLSSFDDKALHLCRALAPEMPLGFLMHQWDPDWASKAHALACYSVHVNRRVLTAERVAHIKAEGFEALAYPVNRRSHAKQLFGWGVDAVFTDYPDLNV